MPSRDLSLAFVIPAYNEEAMIASCLTAVGAELERTGYKAEVVVVDNNCTDRTAEIAASFPFVRVVSETQKGLVYARKAGFDATTAELVANIDADTLLPVGWIDTVLEQFSADEKLVCLSGPYFYHDLNKWQLFWIEFFYVLGWLLYLINRFVLRVGSMVQGGNFVFRRSSWAQVGGYDTRISFYGEDTDIAVRLSKIGKVRWAWKLRMPTSGRRLEEEGVIKTGWLYTLNFMSVTFLGKPLTKKHTDIRVANTDK